MITSSIFKKCVSARRSELSKSMPEDAQSCTVNNYIGKGDLLEYIIWLGVVMGVHDSFSLSVYTMTQLGTVRDCFRSCGL